jgi:hypothetical protein
MVEFEGRQGSVDGLRRTEVVPTGGFQGTQEFHRPRIYQVAPPVNRMAESSDNWRWRFEA